MENKMMYEVPSLEELYVAPLVVRGTSPDPVEGENPHEGDDNWDNVGGGTTDI